MLGKLKRITATILAIATVVTSIPVINVSAAGNGEKKQAGIVTLGKLGTVNIGSKSESGTWVKTLVDGNDVFCLDLGKACHTGYTYIASNSTISSDSSNKKNALEAKIGYWYDQTKTRSNKAWVYAQCLIWAVEEGITSETGLKDIIKQVKNNTGYYANDSLYADIFESTSVVKCTITKWKYSGKTDSDEVQKLMEIVGNRKEYKYTPISKRDYYRQRITLQKCDEDGKELPQVTFRFTAKNIKQLYSYQYNGWGDSVKEDVDDDANKFSQEVKTDSKGKIVFRFTYELNSKSYYYVADEELKDMSSSDKKQIKDELDDKGYDYASDLSKAGAEKLIKNDINNQIDDISNNYVIEEISSGNNNILTSFVVDAGLNKITSQPEEYIPDAAGRIEAYKRIAAIETTSDAEDVLDELIDRYGSPPKSVQGLVDVSLVRVTAARVGIAEIVQRGDQLILYSDIVGPKQLGEVMEKFPHRVLYNALGRPYFSLRLQKGESPLVLLRDVVTLLPGAQNQPQTKP